MIWFKGICCKKPTNERTWQENAKISMYIKWTIYATKMCCSTRLNTSNFIARDERFLYWQGEKKLHENGWISKNFDWEFN